MMNRRTAFLALALALALAPASLLPVYAEDATSYWPNWRGPQYNGVSPTGNPPIEWSETNNVRFNVEVPWSVQSVAQIDDVIPDLGGGNAFLQRLDLFSCAGHGKPALGVRVTRAGPAVDCS